MAFCSRAAEIFNFRLIRSYSITRNFILCVTPTNNLAPWTSPWTFELGNLQPSNARISVQILLDELKEKLQGVTKPLDTALQ